MVSIIFVNFYFLPAQSASVVSKRPSHHLSQALLVVHVRHLAFDKMVEQMASAFEHEYFALKCKSLKAYRALNLSLFRDEVVLDQKVLV